MPVGSSVAVQARKELSKVAATCALLLLDDM
jgi:hypothetical protein